MAICVSEIDNRTCALCRAGNAHEGERSVNKTGTNRDRYASGAWQLCKNDWTKPGTPPQFRLNFATIGAHNIGVIGSVYGGRHMTQDQRHAAIAANMLDIIDNVDCGVPLMDLERLMREAVSFALFVQLINILISNGLVWVDPQHVAHRVKS